MGKRIDFQYKLEEILGVRNVYFQPPSTVQLKYPAIIYELGKVQSVHADNYTYKNTKCYTVTLIHNNPDNDILDKLLNLPMSRLARTYVSNNLYHYVLEIYF